MVQREAQKQTRACLALAVLLSIMLVSMVCLIGAAPFVSGSTDVNGSLSEKELHPNDYAGMLASRLKSTFNTTYIDGRLELVYPIEYGGAYIDSSNNLHIVLSKYATNAKIDSYRSIIGDPDVIFETAEFPLSQLYEIQDSLVSAPFLFDTAGVNEITNRLEIHLPNCTNPENVTEYFRTKFADFDESCVVLLGPNPVTASVGELYAKGYANVQWRLFGNQYTGGLRGRGSGNYCGNDCVACYLAFAKHRAPRTVSENTVATGRLTNA